MIRNALTWLIPVCLLIVPVSVIGLISEGVSIHRQLPVQHGIDAHPLEVTATYSDWQSGSLWTDDKYFVAYTHGDQDFEIPLRSLPGGPQIGDDVCVEIDELAPEHARPCGTRGGLGDAEGGLKVGFTLLGVALAVFFGSHAAPEIRWSRPARPRRTVMVRTPRSGPSPHSTRKRRRKQRAAG
jgi:hypothetical protein